MSDQNNESTESTKADKSDKTGTSNPNQEDRPRPQADAGKSTGKRDGAADATSEPASRGKQGGEPDGDRKSQNPDRQRSETPNPANRTQTAKRPAKKGSGSNRRAAGSYRESPREEAGSKPTLRQPPVDHEELQTKAWELYRADINEEGTSMFNEDEAKDLVRRSFILADIFLRFRDQLYGTGSAKGTNGSAGEPRP